MRPQIKPNSDGNLGEKIGSFCRGRSIVRACVRNAEAIMREIALATHDAFEGWLD